jgi:GNAT superfamily N-acetyltransferase
MLTCRTFCNADPPGLTEIWRSCVGQRGLTELISSDLLEQLVFAKPYFDCRGLIVAQEEGRLVGYAHAGFGPDDQGERLSTELGVTCLVLVRPDCDQGAVAAALLGRCEEYLRGRGAKVLYGGGIRPLNPFYLGLYGGSELPGVLDSDLVAQEVYRSRGYHEIDRTLVLRRGLDGFQALIDRRQMQIRRQMIVEVTVDPPPKTWWEACTLGDFDLTRFELIPRGGGTGVAWATFRSMEPRGTYGIGRAAGLIELGVDESLRRRGLAIFLLSEAFRQFIGQGILLVETQVMQHNVAALGMYQRLGFELVGHGGVFRKG